jgi:hypothetical protein
VEFESLGGPCGIGDGGALGCVGKVMEALWGSRKQHNMGKAEDAHSCVSMPAGLVYTD